jgi:glycosyltransferase involved in cell wall biosynthesis
LVYLEAMNRSNKVIGTKGEGIDGIIKDGGNGFLVEELSIAGVSHKIDEALNASDDVIRQAISTSQKFSYELSFENYKKLITLK